MAEEEIEITEKTKEVLERLGNQRSNLIPILQHIQAVLGYLPHHAMLEVARFLNIPEIDVYSVATFYNQFRLTPPGKHSIRVCMGTACHVKGGHITLAAWQRRLKIGPGETTVGDNRNGDENNTDGSLQIGLRMHLYLESNRCSKQLPFWNCQSL